MTLIQRTKALRLELERDVSEVLRIAETAGGEASDWPELLLRWTGGQQVRLVLTGRGARGDDVRAVLSAVARDYDTRAAELERFDGRDDDEGEDALWNLRHRFLASVVDDSLRAYLKRVSPGPTVGSVFAKAAARVHNAPSAESQGPTVETMQCMGCGAPRESDNLYGSCSRCGRPFFKR